MGSCENCLWNSIDGGHTSMCKDSTARISGSGCLLGTPRNELNRIKQCLLCGAPIENGSVCFACLSK